MAGGGGRIFKRKKKGGGGGISERMRESERERQRESRLNLPGRRKILIRGRLSVFVPPQQTRSAARNVELKSSVGEFLRAAAEMTSPG